MARLFPLRSETPSREGPPRIVDLGDEDADAVFSALSSTTARRIYARLDDEPGTPSDVADSIDSSIQNVRYHLEKLEDAGLVEVVDTWYSSRGNEMSVYATADGPLIVTSDTSRAAQLKEAISRFVGGAVALAGASLLVQFGAERFFSPTIESSGDSGGGDGAVTTDDAADGSDGESGGTNDEAAEDAPEDDGATPEAEEDGGGFETSDTGDGAEDANNETVADNETVTPTDNETVTPSEPDTVTPTGDGAAEVTDAAMSTLPPGLLFFLGGLVVLTVVVAYWYWRYR